MNVRGAGPGDLALVRELWEELLLELDEPPWLAETWEDAGAEVERHVREGGVFLAEEDGRAVGLADSELDTARLGWIDSLYVRPGARRRGVATALVLAAAEALRARGAGHVGLEVNDASTGARALYERLGFASFSRNLAVPLDQLERRARREPLGRTSGAVHVRSEDADGIERAVRQFVPRLGRSAGTAVSGPESGWVTVVDELCDRDPRLLRRLARELSDRGGSVVLALGVEEGAVARYILFDRGRVADEYASVPEYHGPLPPGDVVALAANPRAAERLAGANADELRAAAPTASSPARLPPAAELVAAIAAAFGLGGPLGYPSR